MNELKNWETYSSVSEAENYQNLANLDISDDVSVYNEKEIEFPVKFRINCHMSEMLKNLKGSWS